MCWFLAAFAVTSDCAVTRAGANHQFPVMTNHKPGRKPEFVPIAQLKENDMTLDNEQVNLSAALEH